MFPGLDAADSHRGWYRILTCVWIVLGLMWLGSVISQIQEGIEKRTERKEQAREEQKRMILKTPPPGRLRNPSNAYIANNHNMNHTSNLNHVENGIAQNIAGNGGVDNDAFTSTQVRLLATVQHILNHLINANKINHT